VKHMSDAENKQKQRLILPGDEDLLMGEGKGTQVSLVFSGL